MRTKTLRYLAAVSVVLVLSACSSAPPQTRTSLRALVLVEVAGSGPEAEAYAVRFLSVLSDAGLGNVADARLAGGRLDSLRDATSAEAARFRAAWPGDGYLGIDLPGCGPAGRSGGVRCSGTIRLLSPEGKELAKVEEGASNFTMIAENPDRSPEAEAARAAAEKGARKLLAALPR